MNKKDFTELIKLAFTREAIKKIVFSRPTDSEINKVSCRLCAHRGRRLLAMEYSLPGNTVSHKNIGYDELEGELLSLTDTYRQVNLITTLGDAEWKVNKSGKDVVLGGDALLRRLEGASPDFERAIEALDKKKNYILTGEEKFLISLGISSRDGRVHDKRQGKFRQINRFLEHIEEIYDKLPSDGELTIYDLCCGKSYLSFAVYYYLTEIKGRRVYMLGLDLKRDVINWCDALARELGYTGMRFEVADILGFTPDRAADMVISLHACDIATDIVLKTAARVRAKVILSTPCCHRYMKDRIRSRELSFVTDYPQLSGKLCEAITDALRLSLLRAEGYTVTALELTDPENTPKNTLLRAIRRDGVSDTELSERRKEYESTLAFLLGDSANEYLSEI